MNRWIIFIKMKVISHSYDVTYKRDICHPIIVITASTAAMPRI